jgi:hypothetical protein
MAAFPRERGSHTAKAELELLTQDASVSAAKGMALREPRFPD